MNTAEKAAVKARIATRMNQTMKDAMKRVLESPDTTPEQLIKAVEILMELDK